MRERKMFITPTISSGSGFVRATFETPEGTRVSVRFNSVDEMLMFFTQIMDEAAKVWPEDENMKNWLED